MRIWTIANQKGGVGKTTTTAALGGLCAATGERTLLVDMDPHASLSHYFRLDEQHPGLYQLFTDGGHVGDLAQPTAFANLSVLTASPALATLDRQYGTRNGMGRVLQKALAPAASDYDRVLLDCPPLLGLLMVNALAACERVLIPTQTEFLALRGLERMLQTLAMMGRSSGHAIEYHIIPTLYDARTHASRSSMQQLRDDHGERVTRNEIPIDTQLREASLAGVPAGQWQASRRGAAAYQLLHDELCAYETALEPEPVT
ncbi:MAG: ParA family protein [Rhodanobacteraceae bacterium]